jgi:hypothetical protein
MDPWPNLFHSLFKNKVENATIRLRAHDERNWPSFLYPPGTEYNINELDKNLFRGPIFIRVHSFPFCAVMLMVKLPTDLTNDLYREKFCIYRPSLCPQTFASRNAWYARGFSRGCRLCCCSGKDTIAQARGSFFLYTQPAFCRHTTAFALLTVGTQRIGFSSSTFSLTSASDSSLRIRMIHGLSIPSSS